MTKAPHIITKAPHIMTKAPHIMTKALHIMTKPLHILKIDHLRQSWLSIVFHSQPIYGLANTQTIPIPVFQLTGYQMQSLQCNRLCCTQASFLEATLALAK